jgi:hypothetical protein
MTTCHATPPALGVSSRSTLTLRLAHVRRKEQTPAPQGASRQPASSRDGRLSGDIQRPYSATALSRGRRVLHPTHSSSTQSTVRGREVPNRPHCACPVCAISDRGSRTHVSHAQSPTLVQARQRQSSAQRRETSFRSRPNADGATSLPDLPSGSAIRPAAGLAIRDRKIPAWSRIHAPIAQRIASATSPSAAAPAAHRPTNQASRRSQLSDSPPRRPCRGTPNSSTRCKRG